MNTFRVITRRGILLCLVGLLVLLVALPAQPVRAASYVVNSLADTNDGACNKSNCTLREAINAAMSSSGADTITFSVSGTINLTSTLPAIVPGHGSLTINGGGRSVVIHGGDDYRLLTVKASATLTLRTLSLSNGYANYGGAIHNSGTVNLVGVTVQRCKADNSGGGIYTAGSLTINDSAFSNNTTDVAHGGALYIEKGVVIIHDSQFQGNVAGGSGGAIFNARGASSGGDLTITGTDFLLNSASGVDGGAIFNQGDLDFSDGVLGLNTSHFKGGAFYNDAEGEFSFANSSFSMNSASEYGGAIFVLDTSTSGSGSFSDSLIMHNHSDWDGGGFFVWGGLVTFQRTRIAANHADSNGGGGGNYTGNVNFYDATIENNDAEGDGGGFFNSGDTSIHRTIFSGNEAGGNGGGLYSDEETIVARIENSTLYDNSAAYGGGIRSYGRLQVINCTISSNSASAGAGGGVNASSDTAIYNSIVANNPSGGNCKATAPPSNGGNNIDSGTTCGFGTLYHSHSSTNPLLGVLKDNGGFTKTMMPLPGSVAIDGVTYNPPN